MAVAPVTKLIKVGFSYRQAAALQKLDDTSSSTAYTAIGTVRVATLVGDTVIPVSSVAGVANGDIIVVNRAGGTTETRTVASFVATGGAETITVTAALTNAHEVGESVEESTTTTVDAEPTFKELLRAGFTQRQAALLLTGTSSTPVPFVDLVRQGKFTRHQAKLIRGE